MCNRSKRQLFYPLRWLIYVFNPVVNTKLPAILSHRRSITVSLETYPFIPYIANTCIMENQANGLTDSFVARRTTGRLELLSRSQNGSRHDQGSGIEAEVKQIEYNISFR